MTRRAVLLVALATMVLGGCQAQLPKTWTFSEFRAHAERIDFELHSLHVDLKDNLFGIYEDPKPFTWKTYNH